MQICFAVRSDKLSALHSEQALLFLNGKELKAQRAIAMAGLVAPNPVARSNAWAIWRMPRSAR